MRNRAFCAKALLMAGVLLLSIVGCGQGKKLVMQRGAGICTVKSTPERERACITFLKWLTDADKNLEFVTSLGYMPVKSQAFAQMPAAIERLGDPKYISLYQAFLQTQEQYEFYTAPKLARYLDLETRFEEQVRLRMVAGRKSYLNTEQPIDALVQKTYDSFQSGYAQ